MELKNRVVIVTGAGQGIGQAVALAFAGRGARIVLASRERETLEQTQQKIEALDGEHQVLIVPTDVSDEKSVQQLAEQTLARFGQIDCLVCSEDFSGPTAPLVDLTLEQWQETLNMNLTSAFLSCKAVLPQLLKQKEGNIVLVGSGTGKHALPGRTPYAASKIALVGLARSLAHEIGQSNVRVNVVSPGPVEGRLIQEILQKQAKLRGVTYEQIRQQATREAALRRFTPVEDIARAVLFLATDESITGEDLNVSSGLVII